jgi:precorrin-6Y C5,15-methyltransferase (decarboxylating)
VEWLRAHPTCRAVAVEPDPARAARIAANAGALGVPGLRVVPGRAPAALAGLPEPDAVFVGGGVTADGVLSSCWDALRPGGRLVANAVTVESEGVLAEGRSRLGGELTRLSVARTAPVGGFTGWRPAMPVTIWRVDKPG